MKENTIAFTTYPLSKSQLNIWSLEQSFQGTSINNICETIRIQGTFDVALIQKSLNLIVQSDSSLRTQLMTDENGFPIQYEQPYTPQQFSVFDFSSTDQAGIQHWENSITREVMPVLNAPLFYFAIMKIGEHEGGVLIKTHHLISDGWSQVSLINRIAQTYLALLGKENDSVSLSPTPSYRCHVEDEQKYLSSKAYQKDRIFWQEMLSHAVQPVSIKDCSTAEISPVGQRMTFHLSETLNHALSSFCSNHRVAPFAVFYMALAIYLKRIRNEERICIGAPIHNRSNITDRQTTGMFVSTLPFSCEIDENWTFEELNQHLADRWLDLLRHQRFPFAEIMSITKEQNSDINRLFHLVLSFHNSQAYHNRDTSVVFSGQWHYAGYQAEHLCIHLNNIENERKYSVNYDYLTQLFSKYEIEDFHYYLIHILSQALQCPDKPIYQLSVPGEEEREKVLFSFNQTETFYYSGTLSEKLEESCRFNPSRVAVIQNGRRYTYQTLWEESQKVAAQILHSVPSPNQVIAILLPKSPELLFAMAGIIRSGCAWVILSADLPKQRIEEILAGSNACAVVSSSSLSDQFALSLPVINIDCLPPLDQELPSCPTNPSDLAYLVYTSGSTGIPKGVEIEQHSLLNFADGINSLYGKGAVLSLCNISFDAFLLESIVSLLNSQTIVFPTEYEQENPARIAELIQSYAVGFLATTPSRLTAYLKNAEFYRAVKRLEVIICGGEAFPSSLLKTLSGCTGARIYNQYGPSETTIGISTGLLNAAPLISVGAPMQNCRCYVLDHHLQPLPIGVFGELYIGGECVGRGYHNNPDLTAQFFLESPFEPGERIYKTGDIAAWTENGELVLKGREDNQIKLRGQRIELDEIASRIMLHPAIREATARLINIEGQVMIVAYYVAESFLSEAELLKFSATYLPEYMIPSLFQSITEIPLTSNGKIDYAKLPLPVIHHNKADQNVVLTPQTQMILSVFRNVLNRSDINAFDDYFLCGGDSLNALETLSELENKFGIRLRVADLYACRTAARLESLLKNNDTPSETSVKIPHAPKLDSYPLTPAQLGIYFETLLSPNSTAYNMPCGFRISGRIDQVKLEQSLCRLVENHPILRTGFYPSENGVCQKVLDSVHIQLETYPNQTLQQAKETFVRPFDLSCPPLIRLAVWESNQYTVLLMDLHHIVGDAVSASQILSQLNILYSGQTEMVPSVSFLDYAWWRKENNEQIIKNQIGYWKKQLQTAPPLPIIPTDFPRPKQFDYIGSEFSCSLTEQESLTCEKYCEKNGLTPYMFFTGAFGIFLSKLTGSSEMMVGTPVSNRRLPSVSKSLGLFVNTLPLRLAPKREKIISEYLTQVKKSVIELLDYSDVPLDELITVSGAKRSQGQNPLYHTLISVRPVDTDTFYFDGKQVAPEAVPAKSAKLDLNLEIFKSNQCYHFRIEYATSLFDRETIALYSRSLLTIVREILQNDCLTIEACSAVSPQDRYYLFDRPHTLRMPFSDLSIDRQIDAMAQITPDSPALIFHNQTTTFHEMKQRSDALASYLLAQGVQSGDAVGVLCRRGPELIIAMLAVLKAGGTYVPMLPSFPQNRLSYMIEISNVKIALCDSDTFKSPPESLPCKLLEIDAAPKTNNAPLPLSQNRNEICCILFTSGSTGQPKGVMIRHRSLCNLMAVLYPALSSADGGFLCAANSIFDIFTTETLIAMAFGKYSVMADEEEMVLPWKAAQLIQNHRVRLIEFTPSRAQLFLNNDDFTASIANMPVAMICGEVLPPQLLQKLRDAGCQKIYNLYGPTETTVYSTMDDVTTADRITVGQMYPNCRGYILDEHQQPVMPTASGELYFAGECLAAGYVGREDLTKKSFLPDPFFPGETMYRSGDIVRLLPDGRIDFLGRRDHQIKLNGQRIELAEINQKILDSGLAERAATIVKKDNGYMALRGFIQPKNGISVNVAELRQYLEKELPSYMVPSELYVMDILPCTASGKTDFKALESLNPDEISLSAQTNASEKQTGFSESPNQIPIQPSGKMSSCLSKEQSEDSSEPTSQIIWSAWKETLSIPNPDPDRSFFEQGGNSLAALTLLSYYYSHGLSMTLSEFYDHPTLNDQIQYFQPEAPSDIFAEESVSDPYADTTASSDSEILSSGTEITSPDFSSESLSDKPMITKEMMSELWKQTLAIESVDPTVSFFEQGGNSLAALILLSNYYNHGIAMTLSEFYDSPTLQSHWEHFVRDSASSEISCKNTDQTSVSASLPQSEKNAVFLTDATGFFGAHLVKALIDAGYPKLFCLIRGENPSRLYDKLTWYFGQGWVLNHRSQIHSIPGDLLKESFGISRDLLEQLAAQTSYVIHAAADVRHYACDDSAERTNYEGTAHAISFAKFCHAKLIHISTVSISGEYLLDNPQLKYEFSEDDYEVGQNWRDGVYLRGKFRAEQLVRRAGEEGLPVTVLRIGRLVGRNSDGVFQQNPSSNTFWQLISGMNCLQMISDELAELPMELTAVDLCAQASVLLMKENGLVYHLFNPNLVSVREILTSLKIPVQEVTREVFEQRLKQCLRSEETRLQVAPLLSQYTRLLQIPMNCTPVCAQTESVLRQKGFFWDKPNSSKLLQSFLLT